MEPDIYIKVRFKTSEEGGRKMSLKRKAPLGPDYYSRWKEIDGGWPMMGAGKKSQKSYVHGNPTHLLSGLLKC